MKSETWSYLSMMKSQIECTNFCCHDSSHLAIVWQAPLNIQQDTAFQAWDMTTFVENEKLSCHEFLMVFLFDNFPFRKLQFFRSFVLLFCPGKSFNLFVSLASSCCKHNSNKLSSYAARKWANMTFPHNFRHSHGATRSKAKECRTSQIPWTCLGNISSYLGTLSIGKREEEILISH